MIEYYCLKFAAGILAVRSTPEQFVIKLQELSYATATTFNLSK